MRTYYPNANNQRQHGHHHSNISSCVFCFAVLPFHLAISLFSLCRPEGVVGLRESECELSITLERISLLATTAISNFH